MTRKECLMALMLAGFPVMSLAQTGGLNCQGLIGGAMAQCLQGVGPGRPANYSPPQDDAKAGVTDNIRSLFSGESFGSNGTINGLNCQGLVGGAVAQCLQGIGPGSGRVVSETPREVRAPAKIEAARAGDNATGGVVSSVRNFFSGLSLDLGSSSSSSSSSDSVGPNCQGLVGSAMALCLQGIEPAPGRSAFSR